MINLQGGKRTLLAILEADAFRYGTRGVRGRLANYWVARLPQASGDLYTTFLDTLPQDDLMVIRSAQISGSQALGYALLELGRCVQIHDEARRGFFQTITVGCVALLVAIGCLFSIPMYTHEKLFTAFSSVTPNYYGALTIRFDWFAKLLRQIWPGIGLGSLLLVTATAWSLGNLVGRLRNHLDNWSIWKLYRCMQAMRFLSVLAVLIQSHAGETARLRQALVMMSGNRSRWLQWHLEQMLIRIDAGLGSLNALDTGLIDQHTWWYLCDTAEVIGLDHAIQKASNRLVSMALADFNSHAQQVRWSLLITAAATVLGVGAWHYSVIDDLRQAMMMIYSF